MATKVKIARRKLSLLDLASGLSNVSRACKVMGYSRQQFYEIRRNLQTYGADGVGTTAIMAATDTAKTALWCWQARFMDQGVDGVLRDKTRQPASRDRLFQDLHDCCTNAKAASARGHPLDGACHGQGRGAGGFHGPEDLEDARSRSASPAVVQTLQRSR